MIYHESQYAFYFRSAYLFTSGLKADFRLKAQNELIITFFACVSYLLLFKCSSICICVEINYKLTVVYLDVVLIS